MTLLVECWSLPSGLKKKQLNACIKKTKTHQHKAIPPYLYEASARCLYRMLHVKVQPRVLYVKVQTESVLCQSCSIAVKLAWKQLIMMVSYVR